MHLSSYMARKGAIKWNHHPKPRKGPHPHHFTKHKNNNFTTILHYTSYNLTLWQIIIGNTDSDDFHFLMIAFHFMAPFLAMAELKRALFCSSGLTKTLVFPRQFGAHFFLMSHRYSGAAKTEWKLGFTIVSRPYELYRLDHYCPRKSVNICLNTL